jgi:hypothetical protein
VEHVSELDPATARSRGDRLLGEGRKAPQLVQRRPHLARNLTDARRDHGQQTDDVERGALTAGTTWFAASALADTLI